MRRAARRIRFKPGRDGINLPTKGLSAPESFEETPSHMFVVIGISQGFIVPKRDLPVATVLAARDLAPAHLRRLAGV